MTNPDADFNRPRPLPHPDQLFTVVLWLDGMGWRTYAWTMIRAHADDIVDAFFQRQHFIRSEVWFEGRIVSERIKPDPEEQPGWDDLLPEMRARAKAAWLNAQGNDVCSVCLAPRKDGVCAWCPDVGKQDIDE
jgi:hypothetical protein